MRYNFWEIEINGFLIVCRQRRRWLNTISQRLSFHTSTATSPSPSSPTSRKPSSSPSRRSPRLSMSSPRAQICLTMLSLFSSRFTLIRRYLPVRGWSLDSRTVLIPCSSTEFEGKRQNAVSTHERLQQEAQAVLDVIENPDVAQALRQDKNQNLQFLKDNYNVRSPSLLFDPHLHAHRFSAHARTNHCPLQLWPVPILIRKLQRRCRLPLSLPCPFHRYRSYHLCALGKTRFRHPYRKMGYGARRAQHPPRSHRFAFFRVDIGRSRCCECIRCPH